MKRMVNFELEEWRRADKRKPLILRGARQVGKTHAVRELGKNYRYFLEINFEKKPEIIQFFEKDLDPIRIVNTLIATLGVTIIPGETLLFFDEIQMCPKAITALRYFYEDMPSLDVIAAGSLLDFAIEQVGVPVGRVSFCYVYPLSFMEYLVASQHAKLLELILNQSIHQPMDEIIHQKLLDLLGEYILLGGMPEIVNEWVQRRNLSPCISLQHTMIDTYRQDFPKYARTLQIKYVEKLFNEIPSMISEPFKFSRISGDYKKRELEPALQLLMKAGVVHQVLQCSGAGIPLGATVDYHRYKLLFLDVGLTQAILGLDTHEWLLNPGKAFINKGAITEAFVGQELLCYSEGYKKPGLYYWHREARSSMAELDYLIQLNNHIVPIETKSKQGSSLKSLHLFLKEHEQSSPYGIRFSTHNYSIYEKLHSYPLYAIAGVLAQYSETLQKKLLFLLDRSEG